MARLLLFVLAALALLAAPAAAAPKPATFQVGTAAVDIAPDPGTPVYSGGFGQSPPLSKVHDGTSLEVRAFYVSNGRKALAFAVADLQGWFAATQGTDLGITSARELGAQLASGAGGVPMAREDVIVQSSHGHAAPTLMGIWGPVPDSYIKKVHRATAEAIGKAAGAARPAHLELGTFDAPWLNNIDTFQTDSYPGWAQDGQVSVLRASTPNGASIGSFVNVPAHPDIACGTCGPERGGQQLSPDYFGFVRDALDERLGGTNIVSGATLGREETPLQVDGVQAARFFSGVVNGITGRAMIDADPITSNELTSVESLVQVAGTNPALLALNAAWNLPEAQRQAMLENVGQYPLNRSMQPPYLTGNVIGTYLSAFRIGDHAFLSMPGEPFPEIRNGIEKAVTGADTVVALSLAQDTWGYFYPAWVFPFTAFYETDHHTYNVAPHAGDQIIKAQADNVAALGFDVGVPVGQPMPTRFDQSTRPGVQALASPTWGHVDDDGTLTVTLEAIYEDAQFNGAPANGKIRWDLGDGTTAESGSGQRFTHEFEPGRYAIRVAATDTNGKTATWRVRLRVFRQLRPQVEAEHVTGRTYRFTASAVGGDGHELAYRWRFGDADRAEGRVVEHTFAPDQPRTARVTVADGTTMTASARW
jgi:hypothetical protein